MARRRSNLSDPECAIVHNVHQFFIREKNERRKIHGNEPAKRTAEACQVSERTAHACAKREAREEPPQRKAPGQKRIDLDEFLKSAIGGRVRRFFLRKEVPTVVKILHDCREHIEDFPQLSATTLWRNLRSMGFKYTKRTTKRQLYERHDVIAARAEYLREIKELRRDGRPIIYLDETWCNQHHTVGRTWQDDTSGLPDAQSGKGKRVIILHAGSAEGWVSNAALVFVGKKGSADYHDEMNQTHFEEWWENQLLPNLPPGAVVVLDNAPYHNRRTADTIAPTSSSKKADMISWLTKEGVAHNPQSLKATLYGLVKAHKPKPRYVIDELAEEQGVLVVRSPIGHCELNPIELVWAQVKGYVAKNNKTFKLADVLRLIEEGFTKVTPNAWAKCCDHVVKVEEEYWKSDAL